MKRIIFTLICALSLVNVSAQTAKEILDKAASVVNAKKGATANFVMSGKYGNAAGTISKDAMDLYDFYGGSERFNPDRSPAADDESLPLH